MRSYNIKWAEEAKWFVINFVIGIAAAFVLTEGSPPTDWQAWLVLTVISSARLSVANLIRAFSTATPVPAE